MLGPAVSLSILGGFTAGVTVRLLRVAACAGSIGPIDLDDLEGKMPCLRYYEWAFVESIRTAPCSWSDVGRARPKLSALIWNILAQHHITACRQVFEEYGGDQRRRCLLFWQPHICALSQPDV